jgi:hypothetical protein
MLTVIGHSVLHPGLKLEYFRIQEWEQEWIDAAKNLTREEYIASYENKEGSDTPDRDLGNSQVRLLTLP